MSKVNIFFARPGLPLNTNGDRLNLEASQVAVVASRQRLRVTRVRDAMNQAANLFGVLDLFNVV